MVQKVGVSEGAFLAGNVVVGGGENWRQKVNKRDTERERER